jgi:hypothetical protein
MAGFCKLVQFCAEHGRDAVEDGALFGFDGFYNEVGIELLARIDYGAAMREGTEKAHDEAKAVEERRRTAYNVVCGQ